MNILAHVKKIFLHLVVLIVDKMFLWLCKHYDIPVSPLDDSVCVDNECILKEFLDEK